MLKLRQLFSTALYNLFIKLSWLQRRRYTAWLWHALFSLSNSGFKNLVTTTIHGRKVKVNFGYPYPFIARTIKTFNNPLVQLVYESHRSKKKTMSIIDVGASIGDTALLIFANCPGMVRNIYCIEGESEFFRLLEDNMRNFLNVKPFRVMLSSENGVSKKLVRIHAGTASSIGEGTVETLSLDTLIIKENIRDIDILKIDVDGYDGKVLLGARKFLRKNSPSVIFEWHPLLCKNAGTSPHNHFKVLAHAGYSCFVFFTKLGEFSHFMSGYDYTTVENLAYYCMDTSAPDDWHYDVIALPKRSTLNPLSLATLHYARKKPSPF